jgi:hypothetical protein
MWWLRACVSPTVRPFFKALRAMRATRYDLAIDPVPESTSGGIALTLARARNRLGFANQSRRPNAVIISGVTSRHSAVRCLQRISF